MVDDVSLDCFGGGNGDSFVSSKEDKGNSSMNK